VESSCKINGGKPEGKRPTLIMERIVLKRALKKLL
jgi:hypothetical protein